MSDPNTDLASMENSELEALLAAMPPPGSAPPPVEEPSPEPEAQAAPEEVAAPEGVAQPEAAPEPEMDPLDDFRRQWQMERAAMEAKIELQMAHNSRLAGELGYLKNRPTPRPEPERSEAYDGVEPTNGVAEALSRIGKLEADWRQKSRMEGIMQEIAALPRTEMDSLKDDIPIAAQKFQMDIQGMNETEDPETARLMTKRILNAIIAEAARAQDSRDRESRMVKRASSVVDMEKVKRVGTISASGASAAPMPKTKPLSAMSNTELEALLKNITGS